MRPIRTFTVVPTLPGPLQPLREIAYNLRWAWNHEAQALFQRLDDDLWDETDHNPVLLLGRVSHQRLEAVSVDDSFLAHMNRVLDDLRAYMSGRTAWSGAGEDGSGKPTIAYFSAEFGVTGCLSIFAGGLGVLAGDHLKSASDLGLPLAGVGLLYQQGYFHQYLNEGGWQQESYVSNDFHNLPLSLQRQLNGEPIRITVELPGRPVHAHVWRAQVGRVPLYLLDANIGENSAADKNITDQLYGGDLEMRMQQEILLGIGGLRALEALGIEPVVYHMNEGHSAFLSLEMIRRSMDRNGLDFAAARELASAGLVFTSHTPVPAGHDYFPPELMDRYFGDYAQTLGLSRQEFLGLGRQNPNNDNEAFCMTVLALRLASYSNGVSKLHGEVTRAMWQGIWPGLPVAEIPIGHVTNGVHLRSWISQDMDELYERYLGARWREEPANTDVWRRVERISSEELWETHERRRERLVAFARRRLREQLERRGASQFAIQAAGVTLNPDALTIGFARRFATYKRATLLLRDPDRLARIVSNPERPVQIIFAGKAHPRDDNGKELIRQIIVLSQMEPFRRRLVFLEDYDMEVASHLVQGADIWLNTPRRPLEASGTSGMKAAANGVINVSTLDGWWAEAWESNQDDDEPIGWAIGRGESYRGPEEQDQIEANDLYDLLERDVIPTFFDRDANGLPHRWIARMKPSITRIASFFNTNRMVWSYAEDFYLPAAYRSTRLADDGLRLAKELADWRRSVYAGWPEVRIESIEADALGELSLDSSFRVRAMIRLGSLAATDVLVQLMIGMVGPDGTILEPRPVVMEPVEHADSGTCLFEAIATPRCESGLQGFTLRVLPNHPEILTPFLPGLITWA